MTEFSRPLAVDRVGVSPMVQTVEARPEELGPLAARMMIPAVKRVTCRFRLRRAPGGVIEAEGELEAEVTQVCVLTLDEFDQAVAETFTVHFVPAGTETDDPDPDSPDQIPYEGGAIDLGEAAAEQLALALDPYPKKPGAVPPESGVGEFEGPEPRAPFAALAGLRRKQ